MKYVILFLLTLFSFSVFAKNDLIGIYKQDSYLEPNSESPYEATITIELQKKIFVVYGRVLKKDAKSGKEVWDTSEVDRGTWKLKGTQLVFKTKFGTCTYEYNSKTEVEVPPLKGRGFKFISKSGQKTDFCKKLFIDVKA